MYFKFPCPHCQRNLTARDEHVGRKVVCPYCRGQVAIEQQMMQPQQPAASQPSTGFAGIQTSTTNAAKKPAGAKPAAQSSDGGSEWSDGTNVSMLISGGIGLAATVIFYILVFPLKNTFFGKLFIKTDDAGFWVPIALVLMSSWSMAILIMKMRQLKRQRRSMLLDLLPNEYGNEISTQNVDQLIGNLEGLPGNARESFLINRVKRGLEHFRVRKSAPEVSTVLTSQSEIDANAVDSSYTILNVFIWAIPILGFIGTVIGISAAVSGFSGTLDSANDVNALKESLGSVTGGLATAFDTTLVALVMSMLVMFPSSSLQKSEEDLLNWVDEYCNENLLKRLNDGRDGGAERTAGGGANASEIEKAVNAAMSKHQTDFDAWTKKLDAVGNSLTSKVSQKLKEVADEEGKLHENKVAQLENVQQMTNSLQGAAESLGSYCGQLQQGLTSLNEVLGQLGGQQVVIQVEQPRRRGWFSGRRNGK